MKFVSYPREHLDLTIGQGKNDTAMSFPLALFFVLKAYKSHTYYSGFIVDIL